MKKVALIVCLMLLAGCSANYPLTTTLHLHSDRQSGGVYDQTITARLRGHDARQESAVVAYRLDQPEILLPNETEPHALLTSQLAQGLLQQGLEFKENAPIHIQLNLEHLLADVSRPKILYNATAKSHITLIVSNRGTTLSKTYKREANRESATRPTLADLEMMLNEQLSDIVSQILEDREVRDAIRRH